MDQRPDNASAASALAEGNSTVLAASMANVMQPVSEARREGIAQAIAALQQQGAFAAQMTGSGSAVFGAFEDESAAKTAYDTLHTRWARTWLCSTCMESVVFEDATDN